MKRLSPVGLYAMAGDDGGGGNVLGIELLAFAIATQAMVSKCNASSSPHMLGGGTCENPLTASIYTMGGDNAGSGTTTTYMLQTSVSTTAPVAKSTLSTSRGYGVQAGNSDQGAFGCGGYGGAMQPSSEYFSFAADTSNAVAKGSLAVARRYSQGGVGF